MIPSFSAKFFIYQNLQIPVATVKESLAGAGAIR
jgi:hypothetical protein